jgi:predicted type IV restriction endonuclease
MRIWNDKHFDKHEHEIRKPIKNREQAHRSNTIQVQTVDNFNFIFKGKEITARSAREVMTTLFKLLSQEDNGFLERFASRKHGKKRRYLARDKRELYPGRPDLGEQHSLEIVSGWWLGTNYSRRNIQDIIELALEVVGTQLRNEIKVDVL